MRWLIPEKSSMNLFIITFDHNFDSVLLAAEKFTFHYFIGKALSEVFVLDFFFSLFYLLRFTDG